MEKGNTVQCVAVNQTVTPWLFSPQDRHCNSGIFYINDTQTAHVSLGWPLKAGWHRDWLCINDLANSTMQNAPIQNTLC